ncbi:MAG: tetratricopeptide repeat protein, partial [Acidobacteria bacterium]|nr:tetratricopeptide repeat protein [Acidobacteriota bacterium]
MTRSSACVLVLGLALGACPAAQHQSPVRQARAGWDALNAGRPADAAAAFDQALRSWPEEPSLLLGAGVSAHLLGQGEAARRFLVDALRYDPSLAAASLLLGEVLYRASDLTGAIQVYEQALAHAPQHKQLLAKLEAWRKEASLHDRFAQKLGDHFTVLFEGPAEAELAAKAVEALEGAYWRIGSALYTYPNEVITVVLYTREQFRDITGSPDWAGGAYDGRIRVPVLGAMKNLPEFQRVLAHEFTHALVRSIASRGVPQWLNEGLAMNFDGSSLPAHLARVEEARSRHALTKLEGSFAGMESAAAALAYAQSAAAVRRLIDDAGSAAIVGILTDLARGFGFPEAFERNTNISYLEFQKGGRLFPASSFQLPASSSSFAVSPTFDSSPPPPP